MPDSPKLWDALIALRDEQRAFRKDAIQVVKGKNLNIENTPLGRIGWYLHPDIRNTAINTHIFFRQEIPVGSRSGVLKSQGGQVMFVLEGRGKTVLDGVTHTWQAGDVLNMPLKRDGIVYQHINGDPDVTAVLLVAEVNLVHCLGVDRGAGFDVLEPAPEFTGEK
jgi:hypothetical protein